MPNNNYPLGVNKLPDDNIELIKHNYTVDGGFTIEVYENEDRREILNDNIKDILYNAYQEGIIVIEEY